MLIRLHQRHPDWLIALAGILLGASTFAAEPYKPGGDNTVVESLRTTASKAPDRELRSLRERVKREPTNAAAALDLTRILIQRGRAEADPRFLAQGLVALQPWLNGDSPPVEALVLRATIRQSLHEFDAALQDLDRALAQDPKHVQAWLTKATVQTVRGDFTSARQSCLLLTRLADRLTATVATAQLGSLTGNAKASYNALEQALQQAMSSPRPPPIEQQLWALTVLAEIAARSGQIDAARRQFTNALSLAPTDSYLLGAYADFLLDQNQPDAVLDLLHQHSRIDALWLRVAEAGTRRTPIDESMVRDQVRDLAARFEAAHRRGDTVHRREEARFRWRLCADARGALQLAQDNWKVQKEPADARILLETARAAGDSEAVLTIETWIQTTKLEDVAMTRQAQP